MIQGRPMVERVAPNSISRGRNVALYLGNKKCIVDAFF